MPNNFVLYKPKDVVAGDFYWLEKINDAIFFAVADCTGHGVPGAMVSVVCHSALNRSIREFRLTKPSDILDKTRELVLATFEKSERKVKDGMDISLCSWNQGQEKLHFAGANNSLYIIRKDSDEVEIIKADREPIGYIENATPFTNHEIDWKEGDEIYLLSDGYIDQFGGKENKKYGSRKLKNKLLEIKNESMEKQHDILQKSIDSWMNEAGEEQLDDICIMGIKC